MSDATETVKFNVGGRHFKVSRALIEGHSDTVLGKLVSDTWNDEPDKAVFVDRDGDIFAQILNYLRYGR
jgi:predicted metallo-beta-lactamase superfamily hydrolase